MGYSEFIIVRINHMCLMRNFLNDCSINDIGIQNQILLILSQCNIEKFEKLETALNILSISKNVIERIQKYLLDQQDARN